MAARAWRIGADIGGTFTDIVALAADGELMRIKVLSTPADYSRGIVDALADRLAPAERGDVSALVHATTVATNEILEEKERRLGLVTTAGFRDVLELRRGRRPTLYDLSWQTPPPLVERPLRLEVRERVGADGSVIAPLKEDDVERCAATLRDAGVEAIAVCLVNSYANDEHERRVARLLETYLPGTHVTASAEIAPEAKEFERTSTAVINAFLLPVVDEYLSRLERALRELGVDAPLQVMQSDGTTGAADLIRKRPFLIIESGPAAGVSAAARLSEEMGRDAIITFDMGGTTAKASLVEGHAVRLTEELEVGDSLNRGGGLMRGGGYVVRSPCVDLTEVGSGGGSIAWIDGGSALRVGPRSAGSEPGPACYGGGGTDATVTDAHVVLGYVNPLAIAGGAKPLHAELAHEAVARLADQLELSVLDTAFGIYSIAGAAMRRAVRSVSVERGRDPRAFSLFAFGGAGGIHAASLAAEMGMREVVVPIVAGLFSSLGLLFSDLAVTRVRAYRTVLTPGSQDAIDRRADVLAHDAAEELRVHHHDSAAPAVEILASLRYVGQSSVLTLPYELRGAGPVAALLAAFHAEHRRMYGQSSEQEEVELTSLRARAFRRQPMLTFEQIAARELATAQRTPGALGERSVYFGPELGTWPTSIVSRASLAGAPTGGPLVIEEAEATILVPPEFAASLDRTGSVVLTRLEVVV